MLKSKLAIVGAVIVGLMAVIAIFAPFISTHDPYDINLKQALLKPSGRHLLGTDQLGRDVFSRMVYGARISLAIGFIAVGIATLIGVCLGSIAGYYGGKTDSVIMRFVDIMLCFPTFFLILAVIAVMEPSIANIMVIIGLTSWMGVTRLMRAEVLSLKTREYVESAKVSGAGGFWILTRHLIPNGIGPVLVSATLGVAAAILVESALSFLGLGVQPPTPSWGNILIDGKATLGVAWWLTIFPGLAILVTVLGYNLLGEGIRDYFQK